MKFVQALKYYHCPQETGCCGVNDADIRNVSSCRTTSHRCPGLISSHKSCLYSIYNLCLMKSLFHVLSVGEEGTVRPYVPAHTREYQCIKGLCPAHTREYQCIKGLCPNFICRALSKKKNEFLHLFLKDYSKKCIS